MNMKDPHDLTLNIAGKVTLPAGAGGRLPGPYVYQRTAPGKGNIPADPSARLQLRRYVVPIDPRTPAQLNQRARFANAVQAWHDSTPAEQAEHRATAAKHGMTGFNLFIRRWLRNH